jgi:ankyrin repeat protein
MTDIKPQERSAEEQSDLDSRLIGAADRGDTKAVQTLLASGGDEHAKDDLALRLAAENGYTEIVQALLAAGADVHAQDDDALCEATLDGHTETVRTLLAAGADVHAGDDYALRWAATFGHTEIVQLLVRHIFAPESWRGKSRAEIEAGASALYDKIKANIPSNPIKPEYLRQAASILRDCALDCWFQVRPPPPPGFKISPLPAQARPV